MSNAINSKGVSLASIFDPYVAGTTKARASGIDDAGNDTSNLYANIIYGSAAAATGIKSQNADLNTLYAAKGTAKYNTPDNGTAYSSVVNIPSGQTDSALITLKVGAGQYVVSVYNRALSGSGVTTNYTFTIPSGVAQFQATLTFSSGSQLSVTKTDTPAWTNILGSLTTVASVTSGPRGGASGTVDSNWTLALNFGNAGTKVYTGSNAWNLETDGSA